MLSIIFRIPSFCRQDHLRRPTDIFSFELRLLRGHAEDKDDLFPDLFANLDIGTVEGAYGRMRR